MRSKGAFGEIKAPLPERIKEARLSRGFSISQLAKELGVTRQAVSRYEMGDISPSATVLSKMADLLDFPLSFFTKEIKESSAICGTTYFRSLKSADADLRDMIRIRTKWTEEVFMEFDRYLKFPPVDLPDIEIYLDKENLNLDDIEEIAVAVRKHWGLGLGPISNVALLLEKKGVVISGAETGKREADACSQRRGARPFIFLGKDKKSAVRTRFNLAHELGHILLHPYISEEELKEKAILDRVEKEANMFASAFLMPRASFSNEVMSVSLEHFISLKRRWKVSIAAMIYRCQELELFTPNQVLYLRKQMSMKRWNKNEPLDDELVPETPALLKTAITMFMDKGVKTPAELLDIFKWPAKDLEQICELEEGTLSSKGQVIHIDFRKD